MEFIKKEELGGIQVHASGWSKIAKDYKIKGIPRFMVFDKKGNIVSVDAPRPSSAGVEADVGSRIEKVNGIWGICREKQVPQICIYELNEVNMKYSLLFILGLFCFSELWAGPGKVIIKGAKENVCIYNSERGRGRAYFTPEKETKETVILLPEKECGDLFYLISGDETSWIRVLPDETITVDVRKKPWKFSGDSKAINRYLYGWTQKMFFGKPNALIYRVEMMFHQLPDREKRVPDPKTFYTEEYIEWLDNVGLEARMI